MLYISGHQALNLPCSLETCGDWHTSALRWDKLDLRESNNSIFKDYGIEECASVPYHKGKYMIANTIRAALDLMIDSRFGVLQGLKEDYICNDKYTEELFNMVLKLKDEHNWENINQFMKREYLLEWCEFIGGKCSEFSK